MLQLLLSAATLCLLQCLLWPALVNGMLLPLGTRAARSLGLMAGLTGVEVRACTGCARMTSDGLAQGQATLDKGGFIPPCGVMAGQSMYTVKNWTCNVQRDPGELLHWVRRTQIKNKRVYHTSPMGDGAVCVQNEDAQLTDARRKIKNCRLQCDPIPSQPQISRRCRQHQKLSQ